MTLKVKVTHTNPHDPALEKEHWDTYFESNKYPSYFKEFETKEELGCFILDLVDKENEDVIVCPIHRDDDYRELEVYNDYRE